MIITINQDLSVHIISDDGKRECRLPPYNPETQVPFASEAEAQEFANSVLGNPNYFSAALSPQESLALETDRVRAAFIVAIQRRLDTFAQTRGYDNILSACTYATSLIPKFAAEGLCAATLRDSTWAALYSLLAEVEAGTKPMSTSFADVQTTLPELVWPV
jgi:hypothetical protein